MTRAFWLLLSGYTASSYGNYLNLVALGLFSFHWSQSTWVTGAVMAIRLGSGFLAGLIAGRVLLRLPRRPLLVGLDLLQAAAMLVLILAPSLITLVAVALVLGFGNTTFVVALRSAIPELVGVDQRARANGRVVTGRSLASVFGFGTAALVIDLGGYDLAFAVNAASFLISAALQSFVVWPPRTAVRTPGDEPAKDRLRPWQLLPGLILAMVAVRGVDALASAGHNVALPIYATLTAPDNPAAVSAQFFTAWAIGSVSAHQLVSRVLKRLDHRAFALATCAMSVCFVLAFTGLPAAGLIAVAFLAGVADGVSEIGYLSTLQARPEEQRTRVFGLSASVENSAFAGGMLLAGGLLDVLPVLPVVAGLHGIAVTGVLIFLVVSSGLFPRRHHGELVDRARPAAGADPG
ncbi:MFS transporter [Kribbella sandramycini]|uniref:MFS transporter n=1 Tax=Kribbella sandramycini TaxID=60450 RepID=A0A7Y4L529_9ACTN|nr:MFS transporter [Kribbella sandramycini]MBB6564365.1 putative MFS family arabinose efflux permease [Kribbella sandramycini]NOL44498.1 MFS transporter [Kribbella sandramycini]